jgi:hypothetical protein
MPSWPSGPCSFMARSEVRARSAMIRMKATTTRGRLAASVADRLPYPKCQTAASLAVATGGAYLESVETDVGHAPTVDARNDALTSRYPSPAGRCGPRRSEDTRSAPGFAQAKSLIITLAVSAIQSDRGHIHDQPRIGHYGIRPAMLARAVTLWSCDCVSSRARKVCSTALVRYLVLGVRWSTSSTTAPRRGRSLFTTSVPRSSFPLVERRRG